MTRSLHKRIRWYREWSIRRRAFAWVFKYQEGDPTETERAAFEDWFARDVRHQRAFRSAWYVVVRVEATVREIGAQITRTSLVERPRSTRRF